MRKTKIKHIYYTYHPNAIQDDNDPKGYQLTEGGKWIVEWDVYVWPMKYFSTPEHYTKSFHTEYSAKVFYKKLMKRYEKQEKGNPD